MRRTRFIVTQNGGPDTLQVLEEECPEPKAGEVRVTVLAAGVSLPDLLMRGFFSHGSPGWNGEGAGICAIKSLFNGYVR